jgi:hypothetical protein
MHGAFTICTGMSMNGAWTGIVRVCAAGMILRVPSQVRVACFAAAEQIAVRGVAALRTASTMHPSVAAMTSASALPWFGNKKELKPSLKPPLVADCECGGF